MAGCDVPLGNPRPISAAGLVAAVVQVAANDTVDEQVLSVVQGRISRQDALLEVLERGKNR